MHNIRRQQESSRVRESRIITEYVQFKHPGIYAKAKALYTKLDMLYPGKKDLRRTYEFQSFISGSKENKYKYSRKSQHEISDNMLLDNMLLEIQLMDKSAVPAVVPAVPAVVPAVPAVVPTVPAVVPAVPAVVPTVPAVVPAVPAVVPAVPPPAVPAVIIEDVEITLPVVPDEIIDEIIKSLSQDPDINSFFDDIVIDGETPLEMELAALGC